MSCSSVDSVAKKRVPPQNIQRVLPDAVVPSRDALCGYWKAVGKRALKHLARRPLTLVRHVKGVTFFHEGPLPPIPGPVHSLDFKKSTGEPGVRVWVDDVPGLLGLIEMDAVELHPWQATVDDIEHPDMLVFDIDPGPGIEWPLVTETTLRMRDFLKSEGFAPWAKTTGGKGLHIMVPLKRSLAWAGARNGAKELAARFAKTDPRYTVSSNVATRSGKIFIDYLRNGRGNTAVGAFSPRARPGFPISHPVSWAQVANGVTSDEFKMEQFISEKQQSRSATPAPRRAPSARQGFPAFVEPQLAVLVDKPPAGAPWLHEIKYDGYRGEIAIANGEAKFFTRRGLDWTAKFPAICQAAANLLCRSALLDGEAVALDERGVPNFSKMQDAIASGRTAALTYFAFDLLHLNGRDVRGLPLLGRKARLQELLEGHQSSSLRFSDHVIASGPDFYRSACEHALEGIVSKNANAPYRSGRSDSWRKTKCVKRQEFVVGGWLPREDDPRDLAALLVGYFEGGRFHFAGKVGTGFDEKTRKQLIAMLSKYRRETDPFEETPEQYRKRVRWAEPRVVVEVGFTEFTSDGLIRHGTFRGIREDKKPEDVRLEIARKIPEPGVIASSKARWRRAKPRR